MCKIKRIKAREIIDSRGNPTVECDVITEKGLFRASVPSGASTGKYEALELRDQERRYLGKGVRKAVKNINGIISKEIINYNCKEQNEIDKLMLELDGTPNKSNLGGNAILAVSMAVCKAGALAFDLPLYQYLAYLSNSKAETLPMPMMNIINGGAHVGIINDFQEHMIVPIKASSFSEALMMCSETYHVLKKILEKKFGFSAVQVGDEGGFVPPIKDVYERFNLILKAIEELGYEENFAFATDAAASEFYHDNKYVIKNKEFTSFELIDFYSDLCKTFNLISIEDGLSETDWLGWVELTSKLGNKIQLVGDDLLVTNVDRITKAIDISACNALLIKLNQIGTVSQTLKAHELAKKAGWNNIVSHRSGSTEETFYADLVVGLDAGQFKFGAPARGERTANYNQLLRIEEELGKKAKYPSSIFK